MAHFFNNSPWRTWMNILKLLCKFVYSFTNNLNIVCYSMKMKRTIQ